MLDRLRALLFPRLSSPSASQSTYSYSYTKNPDVNSNVDFYTYLVVQLAPLLILLGLPALTLFLFHCGRRRARGFSYQLEKLVRFVCMVLETLFGVVIPLPWGWGAGNASGSGHTGKEEGREEKRRRRKEREKGWRGRRSSQSGALMDKETEDDEDDEDLYYPGLVNISGTYCFLNSVLQATASLAYLQPYLDAIHTRAVELDVPTPVVDTLQESLQVLNTPKCSRSSFRPVPMINALSQPAPGTRGRSKLFASREHQDAQELFQLLSECIKSEAQAVDAEAQRDRGLGAFASSSTSLRTTDDNEIELSASGVFDGLTANRRSCVACGYTEAVMHFAFATWSLALPSAGYGGSCALQECLSEYTRLELLTDCACRRCSMRATHARLREEEERLAEAMRVGGPSATSQYKKKKLRETRRMERLVAAAIDAGRIEEDIKGVKMERVVSSASTKQAMIARPPKTLVLHLNRSLHFSGSYSSRNPIRVLFPEVLDLTPYTTSGQLSTAPSSPISPPPPPAVLNIPRSTTPTQGLYATPRVLYRLSAVVAHYGAHSYGHYVCFRRKPRVSKEKGSASSTTRRAQPTVPKMPCPYGCDCTLCTTYGPVRDSDPATTPSPNPSSSTQLYRPPRPGKGWLRISDDVVEECGLERVLSEGSGAFLLFYERVQTAYVPQMYSGAGASAAVGTPVGTGMGSSQGRGLGSIYQHLQMRGTPRSSEETVRPADVLGTEGEERAASVSSSVSSSWSASGWKERGRGREKLVRPRVVRRITAGRRERSREVEERANEKDKSEENAEVQLTTGKDREEGPLVASQTTESGLSETKCEGEGTTNGSAIISPLANGSVPEHVAQVTDRGMLGAELTESVVKVELPSPPRTPSPISYSSTIRREAEVGASSSSRPLTNGHTPSSSESPQPLHIVPSQPRPPSTPSQSQAPQTPQTPSPTPSLSPPPSPAVSPSKRKATKNKSRIPRSRVSGSGSGPSLKPSSRTQSASTSSNPNTGDILPDRSTTATATTSVGLRA